MLNFFTSDEIVYFVSTKQKDMKAKKLNIEEATSSDLDNEIDFLFGKDAWNKLGEDEGDGRYCCGKRMVLAPSGTVFVCLKCEAWEYSSS